MNSLNAKCQIPIPKGKELLPFQEDSVYRMLSFLAKTETHACYNCCEQGLGKTIQAIVALNALQCRRILVLCPAVMRLTWGVQEIPAWSTIPDVKVQVLLSSADKDNIKLHNNYVVTSYDLATRLDVLNKLCVSDYWDAIVYDEAHYLKNYKAKRTKAALKTLWPCAKYHIALSGTPFLTRVVDGFTLFSRILPQTFPDFFEFARNFSYQRVTPFGVDYYGVKNADALRRVIRTNFYIRYTKDEVLKELPPKNFQRILLPNSYAVMPDNRREAEELEAEVHAVRKALEHDKAIVVPKNLAQHRRLQGEKKVNPIVEFVQDQLDSQNPCVVFAYHRSVIQALCEAFSKYSPSVIHGDIGAGERQCAIDRFQNGSTLLFIGQIMAAGTGITLTRSRTCVLAELDWSPAVINQAVDRLHRIGQQNQVDVYYFVVERSIDETLTNVVMNRARVFKSVLDKEE